VIEATSDEIEEKGVVVVDFGGMEDASAAIETPFP
jgi:hypothetical protein